MNNQLPLLTIDSHKYIPYTNIDQADTLIVLYSSLFSADTIEKISQELTQANTEVLFSLTIGLAQLTNKIYKHGLEQDGSIVGVFTAPGHIRFNSTQRSFNLTGQIGDVFIIGEKVGKQLKYKIPDSVIIFSEQDRLQLIYLYIELRLEYAKNVKNSLKPIDKLPVGRQCLHDYYNLELIGKGCYGNVFIATIDGRKVAVKYTAIDDYKKPWNKNNADWHEPYFLDKLIRPLIEKKVCPNLPLVYDMFICDKFKLSLSNVSKDSPCIITVMELAQGTLKDYFKRYTPNKQELYSMLFQIMAGLATIQKYCQIMNFDVKKENILYYNVNPGGYWQYVINGVEYLVPNYGKLFILTDFGISRPLSPSYPVYKNETDLTFRLGSRYAIVHNGKFVPLFSANQLNKDGKLSEATQISWTDGSSSLGAEVRMLRNGDLADIGMNIPEDIKPFLRGLGLKNPRDKNFFLQPEIIPPFEFYNDTQDALRMFAGGKRTTQKGHHRVYNNINKEFIQELSGFIGKGENTKAGKFSKNPSQVLASYFIADFFQFYKKEEKNIRTSHMHILEIYRI